MKGWSFFLAVTSQVVVPVLLLWAEPLCGTSALLRKLFRQPFAGGVACLVVIQAEEHLVQIRLLFKPLEQCLAGYPAEGHIAVPLPALRVQRDIGEQVDGGFEHIELPAGSHPVEAVGRIASPPH